MRLNRDSSSTGNSATAILKPLSKFSNKDKVQQMKEIKKYLDTLFKDLKEVVMQVSILQSNKIKVHQEVMENLNKQVKKCFHKIQLNIY
jgi:uridine kinase